MRFFWQVVVFASLGFGGRLDGAALEVTGSLGRDMTADSVEITCTLSQLTAADRDALAADGSPYAKLSITLGDQAPPIAIGTEQGGNDLWWAELMNTPEIEGDDLSPTGEERFRVSIDLALRLKGGASLEDIIKADGTLEVDASHSVVRGASISRTLKKSTSTPNEAPRDFLVTGGHRKIRATWEAPAVVEYHEGVSGKAESGPAPAYVYVVLVDPEVETASLPAKMFSPTEQEDQGGHSCTYTRPSSDESLCISCASNLYLDLESADWGGIQGMTTRRVAIRDLGVDFADVEVDRTWTIFATYARSLRRTSCRQAGAVTDFSMTERLGEPEAKPEDVRCFVATAAYGHAWDDRVVALRWLRDQIVRYLPGGAWLVQKYYDASPPLAEAIRHRPWAGWLVRALLEIPAWGAAVVRDSFGSGDTGN